MIFRIAAVFGYMLRSMILYSLRRAVKAGNLEAILDEDYRNWARFTLDVFGAEVSVEGRENIPPQDGRRLVIVSNHQSQLDIPALVSVLDRSLGFVAKKELASVPLLNFWMKEIGCVIIDRTDKSGSHRALEAAARSMGTHPLVVFPEGTRSKDGRFLPLKLGGFRLALLAGARILPVHIEGTRNAGENRPKGAPARVPVKVRLFPVLDGTAMEDGKASLHRIRDYVDACWRTPSGHPPGETALSAPPAAPPGEHVPPR